jgi:hypothetical protein
MISAIPTKPRVKHAQFQDRDIPSIVEFVRATNDDERAHCGVNVNGHSTLLGSAPRAYGGERSNAWQSKHSNAVPLRGARFCRAGNCNAQPKLV